jgi:amino acid permease
MAYCSIGRHARIVTSGTLNVMLYGVSIVYLLLSSKIINDLVTLVFNLHFGECKMLVLLGIALWPLVMCKSPQDFWWAILAAMSTTLFAVLLIVLGIVSDSPECRPASHLPELEFSQAVMSLGIFMFSFGGHGVFPTIQQDMREPKQFKNSAILAFLFVCVLYLPLALLAYSTYGDSLSDSVINSIQTRWIQELANFFIACEFYSLLFKSFSAFRPLYSDFGDCY